MNFLTVFLAAIVFLSTSVASSAITLPSIDDLMFSKEEAARIRREIKEDPIDLQKVRDRLQRIAAIVVRQNPDLVDLARIIHQDSSWYLQKYFLLKFMLKSKYFEHLDFEVFARERRSYLLFYNVDTVGIRGSLDVSGYDFLRAMVRKDMERQNLSLDEYLAKEIEPCLKRKFSFLNAFDLNSCILRYHAIKTSNFSEFLLAVRSDLKRLELAIQLEMAQGKGPAQYLTRYAYNICDAQSWGWCTESLRLRATVAGKAAGVVFGDMSVDFVVDQKSIHFDLTITTRRELIDFAVSRFGDKVTNLDLLKYLLLKNIERLSDEKVEIVASEVSTLVRDTAEWIQNNTLAERRRRGLLD